MNGSGEKTLPITGIDAVVLLWHLQQYATKYGNDDAERTLAELTRSLSFSHRVSKAAAESALHCCNIYDEEKKFWHPNGATFDEWVKKVGRGQKFNRKYSWFEEKKQWR